LKNLTEFLKERTSVLISHNTECLEKLSENNVFDLLLDKLEDKNK